MSSTSTEKFEKGLQLVAEPSSQEASSRSFDGKHHLADENHHVWRAPGEHEHHPLWNRSVRSFLQSAAWDDVAPEHPLWSQQRMSLEEFDALFEQRSTFPRFEIPAFMARSFVAAATRNAAKMWTI